jgi:hypothetical protein
VSSWKASVSTWLVVIGTVAAAVFAGLAYYKNPYPDLVANVTSYGPVELPPEVVKEMTAHDELAPVISKWLDEVRESLRDKYYKQWKGEARYGVDEALVDAFGKIDSGLRERLVQFRVNWSGGFIKLHIENTGTQTATDLRLTVPDATYIVFPSADKKDEVVVGTLATITKLAPLEAVDALAFTHTSASHYEVERIKLTHATGIGKITIGEADHSFGYWWLWVIGVVWLLWMLALFHDGRVKAAFRAGVRKGALASLPDVPSEAAGHAE